jgi:hypothetical protein
MGTPSHKFRRRCRRGWLNAHQQKFVGRFGPAGSVGRFGLGWTQEPSPEAVARCEQSSCKRDGKHGRMRGSQTAPPTRGAVSAEFGGVSVSPHQGPIGTVPTGPDGAPGRATTLSRSDAPIGPAAAQNSVRRLTVAALARKAGVARNAIYTNHRGILDKLAYARGRETVSDHLDDTEQKIALQHAIVHDMQIQVRQLSTENAGLLCRAVEVERLAERADRSAQFTRQIDALRRPTVLRLLNTSAPSKFSSTKDH